MATRVYGATVLGQTRVCQGCVQIQQLRRSDIVVEEMIEKLSHPVGLAQQPPCIESSILSKLQVGKPRAWEGSLIIRCGFCTPSVFNPQGWQTVAGGRSAAKTPGTHSVESVHPEGMLEACDPFWVDGDLELAIRGCRCATLCLTPGYTLASLQLATAVPTIGLLPTE